MRTRLSSNGQVVLPRSVRRKLGLQPGESLDVKVEDGRIVLERTRAGVKKARILKDPISGLPVLTGGARRSKAHQRSGEGDPGRISMIQLLDVNALLALGFAEHEFHDWLTHWVRSLPQEAELATCSITELGFIRVLAQAPQYRVGIEPGRAYLRRLKANRERRFRFISDDVSVERLPAWVATARQPTDGHLITLAEEQGAKLATLDQGIPEAKELKSKANTSRWGQKPQRLAISKIWLVRGQWSSRRTLDRIAAMN